MKKCVIMGNGPSLGNVDISDLKSVDTFSVNRAYISYEEWDFSPTYYVVHDMLVIEHIKDDLINLVNTNKGIKHFFINNIGDKFDFSSIIDDDRVTIFNGFKNDSSTWGTPNRGKLDKLAVVPTSEKTPNTFNNSSNFVMMSSVVPFSVQIAIYMGYTDIGLVGVDARYVKRNDVKRVDGKVIFTSDEDLNHYTSDYHGKGHLAAEQYLTKVVGNSLRPYETINEHCESLGVKLFSCTENSRVNGFIKYVELSNFLK